MTEKKIGMSEYRSVDIFSSPGMIVVKYIWLGTEKLVI